MNLDDNHHRLTLIQTRLITADRPCKCLQEAVQTVITNVVTTPAAKDVIHIGWKEVTHHTHLRTTITVDTMNNEATMSMRREGHQQGMRIKAPLGIADNIHHLRRKDHILLSPTVVTLLKQEGIPQDGHLTLLLTLLMPTEDSILRHLCHLNITSDHLQVVMKEGIQLNTTGKAALFPELYPPPLIGV
jgi:hypothetical protein